MRKIAFCFLVYDGIHHESIWYNLFKNIDPNRYTIYIHAKEEKQFRYFDSYRIKSIPTEYARISIVEAQTLLLEAALQDKDNQHIIFLSQSCIPFQSFETIYRRLSIEKSYFTVANPASCFPRCNSVLQYIDKKHIQKHYQWSILNRKHATCLVEHRDYLKWFQTVSAPDEHCYLTALFVQGFQEEIILAEGKHGTTFVNWDESDGSKPKSYRTISSKELENLCTSTFLFGRKFEPTCESTLAIPFYRNHIG